MSELDHTLYQQILHTCSQGDKLVEKEMFEEAIDFYNQAWRLTPEPKHDWEASIWVLTAIGDASFLGGFYELAEKALADAIACPGGLGNAFMHLRMGKTLYELNDLDASANELMRAYMGEGEEIFHEEDAKYFVFLKTRAVIPQASPLK